MWLHLKEISSSHNTGVSLKVGVLQTPWPWEVGLGKNYLSHIHTWLRILDTRGVTQESEFRECLIELVLVHPKTGVLDLSLGERSLKSRNFAKFSIFYQIYLDFVRNFGRFIWICLIYILLTQIYHENGRSSRRRKSAEGTLMNKIALDASTWSSRRKLEEIEQGMMSAEGNNALWR